MNQKEYFDELNRSNDFVYRAESAPARIVDPLPADPGTARLRTPRFGKIDFFTLYTPKRVDGSIAYNCSRAGVVRLGNPDPDYRVLRSYRLTPASHARIIKTGKVR